MSMSSSNGSGQVATSVGENLPTGLLAEVQPSLSKAADLIERELIIPSTVQSITAQPIGGGRKRKVRPQVLDTLDGALTRFIAVSASHIAEETSDEDEEAAYAEEVVTSRLEETGAAIDFPLVLSHVLRTVSATRRLNILSSEVIGPVKEASDTRKGQFDAMRLLAAPQPALQARDDGSEIRSFQILHTFAALQDEAAGIQVSVEDSLREDAFDELIGEEILRSAESETTALSKNTRSEIENLIGLGAHLLGEEQPLDAIPKLAAAGSLQFWSETLQKLFQAQKAAYQHALADNHAAHTGFLSKRLVLPTASTVEMVDETAEDFALEVAKAIVSNPSIPFSQRLGIEREITELKRKRRGRPVAATDDSSAAAPHESDDSGERSIDRKLVYVKPDGSEAQEGSDEFEKIFSDYVDKHQGQQGLKEDLENIKDYLKTMDLRAGLPRGLYAINFGKGITRGQRMFSKLYQLKPAEVVGLPTKSSQGHKIRALLVMENDTVGLVGLGHRTEIVRLMKSLGVRGRPRRG